MSKEVLEGANLGDGIRQARVTLMPLPLHCARGLCAKPDLHRRLLNSTVHYKAARECSSMLRCDIHKAKRGTIRPKRI